jgi:hypothetical protein
MNWKRQHVRKIEDPELVDLIGNDETRAELYELARAFATRRFFSQADKLTAAQVLATFALVEAVQQLGKQSEQHE